MQLCVFYGKLPKTVNKTLKITAGKPKHYDMLCLAVVPKKPPDVSRLNEIANVWLTAIRNSFYEGL